MPVIDKRLTGSPWRKLRASFRKECEVADEPCWICRQPIDYSIVNGYAEKLNTEAWEPDHLYPRSTHPHLMMDRANLRASHLGCNRSRGNKMLDDDLGTLSRQWTREDT